MTDVNQIARGIAHQFSGRDFQVMDEGRIRELLIEKISAALREYGEAEYKRGFDQGYVYADVKKADAAGYRRGLSDCSCRNTRPEKERGHSDGKGEGA